MAIKTTIMTFKNIQVLLCVLRKLVVSNVFSPTFIQLYIVDTDIYRFFYMWHVNTAAVVAVFFFHLFRHTGRKKINGHRQNQVWVFLYRSVG